MLCEEIVDNVHVETRSEMLVRYIRHDDSTENVMQHMILILNMKCLCI